LDDLGRTTEQVMHDEGAARQTAAMPRRTRRSWRRTDGTGRAVPANDAGSVRQTQRSGHNHRTHARLRCACRAARPPQTAVRYHITVDTNHILTNDTQTVLSYNYDKPTKLETNFVCRCFQKPDKIEVSR